MSIDDKEQSPIATDSVGENAIEAKETEGLSQGKIVFRKFLRHKGAMVGLIVLFLVTVFAYSAQGIGPIPGWWIFNHTASNPIVNPGGAPTWTLQNFFSPGEHPFGQDEIGRDNFARVMKGTQISIMVMLIIGIVALIIGTIVGALAGYYRGWVDSLLMRVTDGFIILPVIVVGAILGKLVSGTGGAMLGLVLGAILWTGLARLVRGDFLSLREREFVDSARVAGASDFRIMFKHMLPNAMGVIIVNTTLLMSQAIVLEASLSFLGFGISPPDISLGQLISEYQTSFATRPWLFWWPGLFIIVIALCVNFIGDGLRDAFDPRMKTIPSWRKMKKAERMAKKGDK
ncbi:ABC transporter permease [Brevibacterium casei]|uniref:Binding-protein-dependent transport system inner membrane protein n=2 Tax=Brevibacterium casei TaxID=33889 RepID=K9B6T5_9MICO|nr:ABC transporter permease [Brevibacterium casei]NJE68042.1 ABC transporter permease [Brevibacterium sp. LS14]EKU49415.1 binding-protein-dependent transport system inner membrane protein [Brevibacterium casei S18]MBE4694997.1 ABC transporter permease [Brevibacterium casei]MBY3578119.1 ABC transporter permease [Brevibacterium casei]MCT1447410.1 ABC transporter permease [Brevibacterium casei]